MLTGRGFARIRSSAPSAACASKRHKVACMCTYHKTQHTVEGSTYQYPLCDNAQPLVCAINAVRALANASSASTSSVGCARACGRVTRSQAATATSPSRTPICTSSSTSDSIRGRQLMCVMPIHPYVHTQYTQQTQHTQRTHKHSTVVRAEVGTHGIGRPAHRPASRNSSACFPARLRRWLAGRCTSLWRRGRSYWRIDACFSGHTPLATVTISLAQTSANCWSSARGCAHSIGLMDRHPVCRGR